MIERLVCSIKIDQCHFLFDESIFNDHDKLLNLATGVTL